MTMTTTEMTPAEFLDLNPHDLPDWVNCNDPRLDSKGEANDWDGTEPLPRLAELLRRLGGLEALPRYLVHLCGEGDRAEYVTGDPWALRLAWDQSLQLWREGHELIVEGWHPHCDALTVHCRPPADGDGTKPWEVMLVMGDDLFPVFGRDARLAVRSLDYRIGQILNELRDGYSYTVHGEPFTL
jgi:hypothetical protein